MELSSLCNRLSLALLALAGATAAYSVSAHNNTVWRIATWILIPGVILMVAGRLIDFLQSIAPVTGASKVLLLASAAAALAFPGWRLATGLTAYAGVVVRKSVDPWTMFPSSRLPTWGVRYEMVVRDARGNESTHIIDDIDAVRIHVGDTVVKKAGMFEDVHRVARSP